MAISEEVSRFAHDTTYEGIPVAIRERAKHLILDAIGIAHASGPFDFAKAALAGVEVLGVGSADIFGLPNRLALRDAIMINGILVHGLDYDDTYLPGSMHLTSSSVPTAFGVAAHAGATGRDMLTACIVGMEIGARLARAGGGSFQRAGFHPTSVCGAFSAALVSGRLMALTPHQLTMAQGIALSTASGTMEPMQDGAWTKRMHPGWAGAAGVTAAGLAKAGYVGPVAAYEGKFGLYKVHLGEYSSDADLESITAGLGEDWQFARTSIKLYPACHHIHAFLNAALSLASEYRIRADQIESVQTLVESTAIPLICEPAEAKCHPQSSYIAEFSLQYAIACCLARGRFGLRELDRASYTDPELTALAGKVKYAVDANSGYPKFRTGDVRIKLKDGRELHRRGQILPDKPAANDEIVTKFVNNARSVVSEARASEIRKMLLAVDGESNVARVSRALSGP